MLSNLRIWQLTKASIQGFLSDFNYNSTRRRVITKNWLNNIFQKKFCQVIVGSRLFQLQKGYIEANDKVNIVNTSVKSLLKMNTCITCISVLLRLRATHLSSLKIYQNSSQYVKNRCEICYAFFVTASFSNAIRVNWTKMLFSKLYMLNAARYSHSPFKSSFPAYIGLMFSTTIF